MVRISSIVLAVCAFTLCVVSGRVAQTFMEMFADFGAELPALTRILLGPSLGHWVVLGLTLALGIVLKDVFGLSNTIPNGAIILILLVLLLFVAFGLFLPMLGITAALS